MPLKKKLIPVIIFFNYDSMYGIHGTFYSPEPAPNLGKVMRVSGEVEFVDDLELRTKVYEARPFLKERGIKGPEDPMLAVFRVPTGEVYIWTREYSMRESEIERIRF